MACKECALAKAYEISNLIDAYEYCSDRDGPRSKLDSIENKILEKLNEKCCECEGVKLNVVP